MAIIRERAGLFDHVDRRSAREAIPTADDVANTFPLPGVIDNPNLLLVEHEAQVIGYAHVWWRWTEVGGTHVYLHLGYVLPTWRGRGIGRAMVQWAHHRIREIAVQENAADDAQFATNVSSTEHDADSLMQHFGYTAVRRMADMVLEPIPALVCPDLPTDLVFRALESEHYRPIYDAWKDALSDFWTSTPESDADYQEFLAEYIHTGHFASNLWQVAWLNDTVVGVIIAYVMPHGGIIDQVTVRRAWHRRGVGRALFTRALNALHQQDIDHVRLYTDAANEHGARGFYEQFGFHEAKQHIFYRKPLSRV